MFNCYGLKELHHYLSLPFLSLKRDMLLDQLKRSAQDLLSTASLFETPLPDSSYSDFANNFTKAKSIQQQQQSQQQQTQNKVLAKLGLKPPTSQPTQHQQPNNVDKSKSSASASESTDVQEDVDEGSNNSDDSGSNSKQLTKEEKRRKFREQNGVPEKTASKKSVASKAKDISSASDDMNSFIRDRFLNDIYTFILIT